MLSTVSGYIIILLGILILEIKQKMWEKINSEKGTAYKSRKGKSIAKRAEPKVTKCAKLATADRRNGNSQYSRLPPVLSVSS